MSFIILSFTCFCLYLCSQIQLVKSIDEFQQFIPPALLKEIGLCAVVKDDPHINSWLEYHKALGIDHVILIDGDSKYPVLRYILQHVRSGFVLNYIFEPTAYDDPTWVYNFCMKSYGENFDFVSMMKTNEYIVYDNNEEKEEFRTFLQRFNNNAAVGMVVVDGEAAEKSEAAVDASQGKGMRYIERSLAVVVPVQSANQVLYRDNQIRVDVAGQTLTADNDLLPKPHPWQGKLYVKRYDAEKYRRMSRDSLPKLP